MASIPANHRGNASPAVTPLCQHGSDRQPRHYLFRCQYTQDQFDFAKAANISGGHNNQPVARSRPGRAVILTGSGVEITILILQSRITRIWHRMAGGALPSTKASTSLCLVSSASGVTSVLRRTARPHPVCALPARATSTSRSYVDRHFTPRFDAFAGIALSYVKGGLAIAIPHGPGVPYRQHQPCSRQSVVVSASDRFAAGSGCRMSS